MQSELRTVPARGSLLLVAGLVGTIVVVGGILALLSSGTAETSAVVIGLLLVVISAPILARRARLEGDRVLFWILLFALILKLAGAMVRYYVAFDVYGGVADAAGYDGHGARIAENLRAGVFDTGLTDLTDTNFIRLVTGIVYTFIGRSIQGGFLVFSWLGFWGLYWFYRAFKLAVPEGRAGTYGKLVLFMPSLLFWPSSIGKEAWMVFALGLAAFGVAQVMARRGWKGFAVVGLGLWLAALVRPHVAAIVAVSLLAAYLIRPARREGNRLLLAGKVTAILILAVGSFVLVRNTDRFLRESGIGTKNVVAAIQGTFARSSVGRSQFQPSVAQSPERLPIATATVLFRPVITEAHNAQAFAAALEGTFLLVLTVVRIPWILSALRSVRRQPYVAFAIVYSGAFIVAFSGIANFGLLARQRVQLLPLYLVLLAIPPPRRDDHRRDEDRAVMAEV
jgi:hypothetical protein